MITQPELSGKPGQAPGRIGTRQTGSRKPRQSTTAYPLSELLYCSICNHRMQGTSQPTKREGVRRVVYRCEVFKGRATAPELAHHPRTLNVGGRRLEAAIDEWIDAVASDPAWLASLQQSNDLPPELVALRTRRRDVESRIGHLLNAIETGVAPESLLPKLAERQRELADIDRRAALLQRPRTGLTEAQITALIADLGGIAKALEHATPEEKRALYRLLGIHAVYDHAAQTVTLRANLGGCIASVCPEGDLNPHALYGH